MAAGNEGEREKGSGKKKKDKATPKKERQISLRLSAKGAKRLNKLTEATEWSVTQVVEEALKVYAAREGIVLDEKADDIEAQKTEERDTEEKKIEEKKTEDRSEEQATAEQMLEDATPAETKAVEATPDLAVKKLSSRKPKVRQTADTATS